MQTIEYKIHDIETVAHTTRVRFQVHQNKNEINSKVLENLSYFLQKFYAHCSTYK